MLEKKDSNLPWIGRKVYDYICEDPARTYTLEELAKSVGMSKFNFNRTFARQMGTPPVRWIWTLRIAMAREIIDMAPGLNLIDVAVICGFSSASHFSRHFKAAFASTPSCFRAQRSLVTGNASETLGLSHISRALASAHLKAV